MAPCVKMEAMRSDTWVPPVDTVVGPDPGIELSWVCKLKGLLVAIR